MFRNYSRKQQTTLFFKQVLNILCKVTGNGLRHTSLLNDDQPGLGWHCHRPVISVVAAKIWYVKKVRFLLGHTVHTTRISIVARAQRASFYMMPSLPVLFLCGTVKCFHVTVSNTMLLVHVLFPQQPKFDLLFTCRTGWPLVTLVGEKSGKLGKVREIVVCLWCATTVVIVTK